MRLIVPGALVLLAGLAFLGRSLVMLTSVGGIALALWVARRRPRRGRVLAAFAGAVAAALGAEVVHVLHHAAEPGMPDHGGFWWSAVLVGLIDGTAMAPALWAEAAWARRGRR